MLLKRLRWNATPMQCTRNVQPVAAQFPDYFIEYGRLGS